MAGAIRKCAHAGSSNDCQPIKHSELIRILVVGSEQTIEQQSSPGIRKTVGKYPKQSVKMVFLRDKDLFP